MLAWYMACRAMDQGSLPGVLSAAADSDADRNRRFDAQVAVADRLGHARDDEFGELVVRSMQQVLRGVRSRFVAPFVRAYRLGERSRMRGDCDSTCRPLWR